MTGAVSLTSGVAFHVSSYRSAATGRTDGTGATVAGDGRVRDSTERWD